MNGNGLVTFKGKKNGIMIILDRAASFEELKSVFTKKVSDARDFFGDSNISVTFSGRILSPNEKKELIGIMEEESSINVSEAANQEDIIRPTEVVPEHLYSQSLNQTMFHKGSLRSGQSIRHDGSIVVLGDVNPGAILAAKGNIIVLGSLKGFVHAGMNGDDTCYISALNLIPTQIRIADIITYIPPEMNSKKKQVRPSYAYVEEGRIYIASL